MAPRGERAHLVSPQSDELERLLERTLALEEALQHTRAGHVGVRQGRQRRRHVAAE